MSNEPLKNTQTVEAFGETIEPMGYQFSPTRRDVVQTLGAGLLITVLPDAVQAQRRGREGGGGGTVAARLHIGKDGTITVMTGKVEGGQGARAQLTQAAAEELRVPAARVQMLMADTGLVPDDGITAGSRTTPSTLPAVRQGCAAARELLAAAAAGKWGADRKEIELTDAKALHRASGRELSYPELAAEPETVRRFEQPVPANIELTPVAEWKTLGRPLARPNRRDLVTGAHAFPSDIVRPGLLRAKVLRAPAYGAKLISIDLEPARGMKDIGVVREGDFIGVAAPTTFQAERALAAIAKTAKWETPPHPSSGEVFDYLRKNARERPVNPFSESIAKASRPFKQTYHVAYVQHSPLEPRAAVAEWEGGKLTVWTGSQNPFGVHGELAQAFQLPRERVRVIVPDFGAGFGGKHTGEAAVEAARISKGVGAPVSLRWTREEEFTWAYFRPAAVIDIEAGLGEQGRISSWWHVNINSGQAAIDSPYRIDKRRSAFIPSNAPLRQGSYRALAAAANNFARECFMDELSALAGSDPLAFRLAHIDNPRLRAVLEEAARRFGWAERVKRRDPATGVGLACGTEKGSYVAACVEIGLDRENAAIIVRRVCEVFECGPVINPDNLLAQVQGCLLMGLGPALREQMVFEEGRMLNASFWKYEVPRFSDVPELDIHFLNRPDLPPVGGGETPIIAVAPAIANAVFHATGTRVRAMPIRPPSPEQT